MKQKHSNRAIQIASIAIVLSAPIALAQADPLTNKFNYQGLLTEGGTPVTTEVLVEFTLWSDPDSELPMDQVGGALALSLTPAANGLFTVELNDAGQFGTNPFDGEKRWLKIVVDGNTLSPRQEISGVPYALQTRGLFFDENTGNVGIGTTIPSEALSLEGKVSVKQTAVSALGEVRITRPDSTPGFVSFADNGNRRDIRFYDSGIALVTSSSSSQPGAANGIRIDEFGNVGIGTSVPKTALHIDTDIAFDLGPTQTGQDTLHLTDNASGPGLGNVFASIGFGNGESTRRVAIAALQTTGDPDQQGFAFFTHPSVVPGDTLEEKMRIQHNGNVGIGTTSPGELLHVAKDTNPNITFENNGDITGSRSVAINFDHSNGTGAKINAARLSGAADGMNLQFLTQSVGGSLNEQMRIDPDGNVGIGTTSPSTPLAIRAPNGTHDVGITQGLVGGTSTLELTTADSDGVDGTSLQAARIVIRGDRDNADIEFYRGERGSEELMMILDADSSNVGIGTANPGNHKLSVLSSDGGVGGATVFAKNTNTTSGIAMSVTNESTGVTLLVGNTSTVANGNLIRCDSWVGGWHPVFSVSGEGRVTCSVIEITGPDLAEKFPFSGTAEPGMVVQIDPQNPGKLRVAEGAYNRMVAGIVSNAGDLHPGAVLGNLPDSEGQPPIALSGRVWTMCDTSNGPIKVGDLLTTSDTPGQAMKVTDYPKAQGAIIGKAMSSLKSGKGLVLVLVSLQ